MSQRFSHYDSDEALQEMHDEMYQREESRPKSGVSDLDQRTKFFIGLALGGLVYLLYTERIALKEAAIFGIAGFVIYFMVKGTDPKRQELTWLECMIRIHDLLKFLQKHPIGDRPQIPRGEIHITPRGRKQWYEGKAFKRSFGIQIYDEEMDIDEWYFLEVDVFTGDIITFQHKPEGVYGDETKDIKLMPTYDMLVHKKRDQYLSKSYKI